jgi:hypothetical protein
MGRERVCVRGSDRFERGRRALASKRFGDRVWMVLSNGAAPRYVYNVPLTPDRPCSSIPSPLCRLLRFALVSLLPPRPTVLSALTRYAGSYTHEVLGREFLFPLLCPVILALAERARRQRQREQRKVQHGLLFLPQSIQAKGVREGVRTVKTSGGGHLDDSIVEMDGGSEKSGRSERQEREEGEGRI